MPEIGQAIAHIGLGERDQALQYRQQAFTDDEYNIRALKVTPVFDPLRSYPALPGAASRDELS